MIPELAAPRFRQACAALRAGLAQRLEESTPPRQSVHLGAGHLLISPAADRAHVGVKVVSVAPGNSALGRPTVQGGYLLMDAATLTPLWQGDAAPLTLLRTAAVSMVAIELLGHAGPPRHAVIVGSGPQATAHAAGLLATCQPQRITLVARRAGVATARAAELSAELGVEITAAGIDAVADADLVICVTSAATPLFTDGQIAEQAIVVAVGSHTPESAELPAELIQRAAVYVEHVGESMKSGDLRQAAGPSGELAGLVTIGQLVRGEHVRRDRGPWVFKSVGQGWEDLCVAAALHGSPVP